MITDVELALRIFSIGIIFVCLVVNSQICFSADRLHNEVLMAKESILLKISDENEEKDFSCKILQTANIISQQATSDIGITALGFFKLSKSALLTIYSFVITYVVILLQSPSGAVGNKSVINVTTA
uniref:Uncharacterized protein n=1 Tax=Plectus sambesii TaxID=2011161 RepID=A0A914XLA9_9BILA